MGRPARQSFEQLISRKVSCWQLDGEQFIATGVLWPPSLQAWSEAALLLPPFVDIEATG